MFQDSTFSTIESLSLNKEQFARQKLSLNIYHDNWKKKKKNFQIFYHLSFKQFTKYFLSEYSTILQIFHHSPNIFPFHQGCRSWLPAYIKGFQKPTYHPRISQLLWHPTWHLWRMQGRSGRSKIIMKSDFSSLENWNGKGGLLHSSTCKVSMKM